MADTAMGQGAIPTKGKEFWVGFMQNWIVSPNDNEQLNLFITSEQNTSGTVEIPGQGWSVDFTVTANQTTTVNVPNNIAEHLDSEVIHERGIYVATEDTVAVFAINFQNYTADGTRILPIQTLGTEYRVAAYRSATTSASNGSELLVVATEDDTEVEIIPTVNTFGGNPAGVPIIVQLNRGQSYQVKSASETLDLTGTVVRATEESGPCRPFAVFSGAVCAVVPGNCTACDHIYEQNMPTQTWGSEYVVIPFNNTTRYTYRVLAHEDNTTFSANGGAPTTINAGQFIEFNAVTDTRCVEADKPIAVIQYMEGFSCAQSGDPAMLILSASDQSIDQVTFTTVTSTVITQHSLSVIVEAADVGSFTVNGVAVPATDFTPVGTCENFYYSQLTVPQGSHELYSPNGMTVYVYGTGDAESYAYSVGSYTPPPPINIDYAVCSDGEVTLGLEAAYSNPYWYGQSDPETILGNELELVLTPPIVTDIYVGVGELFLSGCEVEVYYSVENPEPLDVSVSASMTSICNFQESQLQTQVTPPGNYQYSWSPPATLSNANGANPIASPSEDTSYEVLVTTLTGCSSGSAEISIEVAPGSIAEFAASTTADELCLGEEAEISFNIETVIFDDNFDPGVSWGLWDDIVNGASSENCGSVTGNALWFNGPGVRSAATNPINVENGGTVIFYLKYGTDVAPCDAVQFGEEVVLEYSIDGGGGPWNIIETFPIGMYEDFHQANVNIPPVAQTANTRFRWRQLATSGANQDNWAIDNVQIGSLNTVNPALTWFPTTGLEDPEALTTIAAPTEDTWYSMSFFDVNSGCQYNDSVFIGVIQTIEIDLTPDTVLCGTSEIQLEVTPLTSGNFTYTWTGQNLSSTSAQNPIASPTESGLYTVTLSTVGECSITGELEVIISNLQSLTLETSDDILCPDETAVLTATVVSGDPVSFEWSPIDGLEDPSELVSEVSPASTATYSITVTDDVTGCPLTQSVEIQVSLPFEVDAGEDEVLCVVNGYQLNATTDATQPVNWSWTNAAALDNATISNPTIQVDESFVFFATATDDLGCSVTDSVAVDFVFESFALGPDQVACVGDVVTISSGLPAGWDHTWSNGGTDPDTDVTETDTYSVNVLSPEGCEVEDDILVTFTPLPVIDFGDIPVLCEGEQYELSPGVVGAGYEWTTGAATSTIQVNQSGSFGVTVTDNLGCEGSGSIELTFYPLPVINLGDSLTVCEDQVPVLDAENPGSSYNWSNGESTQVISVLSPGIYSVEVTTAEGCLDSDQIVIEFSTYPVLDLGEDDLLCEGQSVALDAGNPTFSHLWSTGETTQEIVATETGLYQVAVDNGYCVSIDEVSLTFSPLPQMPDFAVYELCPEEFINTTLLNALNSGSTYLWNTGSTSQTILPENYGAYWVEVTTAFGCMLRFDHLIANACEDHTLFIPNAFTPGTDGINDIFKAEGTNIVDFELTIYNRWGEVVWQGVGIDSFWDGSFRGGSHYVEAENYVYNVNYTYRNQRTNTVSEVIQRRGFITVIR